MDDCKHQQLVITGGDQSDIECQKCGAQWYYSLDGWAHYQLKEM